MKPNKTVKAYNMAMIDNDSAEINMYGDVVSIVPRDWQTNERLAGFIGVDEFLEDFEAVKDKANLTIHINSGGGDLYAGLAIYNRLKEFKGILTTVNDGLAASAASLIFQAGDNRKMNSGSNLMAHGVSGFLFGYYDADDLKELLTQFKAHNKAIVNVYAEAMGVSFEEAKGFINGETWLTGQEAVDKGLADEVIEEEQEEPVGFSNRLMKKLRDMADTTTFKVEAMTAAVPPIANKKESIEGGTQMEIKNVTDLKNAYPELVAQIESAAVEDAKGAVEAERARIKAIEEIENSIADKELVKKAKYDEPMTAEDLAFQAMKAMAAQSDSMLAKLDESKEDTEGVNAVPAEEEESEEQKEEEQAKNAYSLYAKFKR